MFIYRLLDYKVAVLYFGRSSWNHSTYFSLCQWKARWQAILVKYTFLSCSTHTSSLQVSTQRFLLRGNFSTPSRWALYSAWHSTLSPWRLGHDTCSIIGFHVFLSRRWTSCLVYLGVPADLRTCGHSKRSINISWINK